MAQFMERASSLGGGSYRLEVDPAAGRVHALHLDLDRVAEADRSPAAGAVEDRLGLVELPPVPAQPAHRQQPLVAVAEAHERADRRETRDLALPPAAPTGLEQLAFDQEPLVHVLAGALDGH